MSVCYIFSGGVMSDDDLNTFELPDADYVISADAGFLYSKKFGFATDCLVGDFDTLKSLPNEVDVPEIIKHTPEKDDTDTMLAVKLAIEKGFDEIYIFGALGGRFDHTFANIQALQYISDQGKRGYIVSKNEYVTLLSPSEYKFKKREGFSFSVFSFSEKAEAVTEKGFKYNLDNAILEYNFPLGVCNEIIEDYGTVSFKKGRLLVIISKNQNLF